MVNDQSDLLYYLSSNIPGGNNPVHLYVVLLQCGVKKNKKKQREEIGKKKEKAMN